VGDETDIDAVDLGGDHRHRAGHGDRELGDRSERATGEATLGGGNQRHCQQCGRDPAVLHGATLQQSLTRWEGARWPKSWFFTPTRSRGGGSYVGCWRRSVSPTGPRYWTMPRP